MTLPTSGPLSLLQIQGEFGGSNPAGFDEYYRGGANVPLSAPAGTGSFQTEPMTPDAGPIQIPDGSAVSGNPIQMSHFYGTSKIIIGNTGIIEAPYPYSSSNTDYVEYPLPFGVQYIRFYLVGGGGGGGGKNIIDGGRGQGGSTISGTIDTSFAGSLYTPRFLRFLIGKGGAGGLSQVPGNTITYPQPVGGLGYPMNATQSVLWGTFINTYGVSWAQTSGGYEANDASSHAMVYFPSSDLYTFQFTSDNFVVIQIDGVQVAANDGTSPGNDQNDSSGGSYSRNIGNSLTKTVSVTSGIHKVTFLNTNTGNIGGYALNILDQSGTSIWNTRVSNTPVGGNGGIPGNIGISGQGGAGGAATELWLVTPFTAFFIACAGGGGGGGGAGNVDLPNNTRDAIRNQGWDNSYSNPPMVTGGEGEFVQALFNQTGTSYATDGGGGGGGGGGLYNPRSSTWNPSPSLSWQSSGMGGKITRGNIISTDNSVDGGESGRSGISSLATTYADFVHAVTTTDTPVYPADMPVNLSVLYYGKGGAGSTNVSLPGSNGADGAAYVDWGITDPSVTAPDVTYYPIVANSFFYQYQLDLSQATIPGGPRNYTMYDTNSTRFTVFAYAGGGRPAGGDGYTYLWQDMSSTGATITSPNSPQTDIVPSATGTGGVLRCTVSDGYTSAITELTWEYVSYYTPPLTCFPAGSMVTMADGTLKAIENISVGDKVMGMSGSTLVTKVDRPKLGKRKLLRFEDGHTWSEEHAHWTRDSNNTQWWWSANADLWRSEVIAGAIGGLTDNNSMRTGEGFSFAHIDGWKTQTYEDVTTTTTPDLQLYLPLTDGSPIIVDGYVVGAGVNQKGFDYTKLDWDIVKENLENFSNNEQIKIKKMGGAVSLEDPVQLEAADPNWEPPPVADLLPKAPL